MRFHISWSEHGRHHLIATHPWGEIQQYRVKVGRIILRDRRRKVVEAFSLGGILEIVPGDSFTALSLTSTAPILALLNPRSFVEYLVEELEVVMAIMRSDWQGDSLDLEVRLAQVDPADLFRASLLAIEERLRSLPHGGPRERDGLWRIDRMIAELRAAGQLPLYVPSLSELLG